MLSDECNTDSVIESKEGFQVSLSLILFEEDGSQIMYCPALDISGYGKTEQEAKESFYISLLEFIRYTTHKKTFNEVLTGLGWKVKHKNRPRPPEMSKLLQENDNFNRIFNSHSFKKTDENITIPYVA